MELTIKCQLQLYICIDTTITVFPNKTTLLLHVSSFSLKNKKKNNKKYLEEDILCNNTEL